MVQFSHPYMTTWETIALTRQTFVSKVMSLFNTLSRLVIAFLSRRKCFSFRAAVTVNSDFGAQENSLSLFPLFLHLFAMKWWNWMPWCSFFECWVWSQLFTLFFHLYKKRLFSSSSLSAIRVVSSAYLRWLIFLLALLIQLVLHPAQHFLWCTPDIS